MRPAGSSHTCVLIEDDPLLLPLIRASLDGSGYTAVTATEWDRASEVIEEIQPELVIIDSHQAHGRWGWKFVDTVRHDEAVPLTPIIIYSAAAHELERDARVLEEFSVLVLPQPVDVDDLPRRVGEMIVRARAAPRGSPPSRIWSASPNVMSYSRKASGQAKGSAHHKPSCRRA